MHWISPQVDRLILKFGTIADMSNALRVVVPAYPYISWSKNAIAHWRRPYALRAGNGGRVPSYCVRAVLHAARLHGIIVTAEEFFSMELVPYAQLMRGRRRGQRSSAKARARSTRRKYRRRKRTRSTLSNLTDRGGGA